ncbi:hypothetical protein CMO93_01375 [Candidatus Woesearchaeota archaeon]|nr:hypothetical protein [Candidatus Woesearchaeota archaeon]|tara:strand:- start:1716 stop:2465 length:750 start_codon:yes stop_codon:yes gene_type:complete
MFSMKKLFGFKENNELDKTIIQKNPYKNMDLNKRQFIKKGILGLAGLGGIAAFSKMASARYFFSDATSLSSGDVHIQGKYTIFVPAAAMRPTSSNGCAVIADVETTSGRPDMQVLDFGANSDEHAQFQVAFPNSWNAGTITFKAFWTSAATDTDGVAVGLQGVAVSNDDTIDVAYGTAVVVTDDNISAAEDLLVTGESSAVTIGGTPAAGDMCFFRVFRDVSDANDDMTEDMRLIGIQLYYTTNASDDT